MKPLISVIVPVFNVEDYLDRCVESIVNQSYSNLEIILVDDGSNDSSGQKSDEWLKKDDRIVVIHKNNGGLSEARNEGLRISNGQLIGFVDSDDYVDLGMYESMLKTMVEYNCDIVECCMKRFSDQNDKCSVSGSGKITIMSCEETIKDYIMGQHLQSTVPNMLIKSSIAKKVFFDVGKINEDVLWSYRAYALADSVVFLDYTYYYYYQRQNSTMNTKYSYKRFDGLDALEEMANLVKKDFPQHYHMATRSYLGSCMYQYQYLCRQPKSDEFEDYKTILHNRFCEGDQVALFDGLNSKYKLWYSLFRIAPSFTAKIRNVLKIGL